MRLIFRNTLFILLTFVFAASSYAAKTEDRDSIKVFRSERGLTDVSNLFVPKGQWIFGLSASYSVHNNDNYSFVIVEGINSNGYTIDASHTVAYSIKDNMVIGARIGYSRTFLKIDNAQMSFGDEDSSTDIVVNDYYGLKHIYSGSFIWRQYIPLGPGRRFALFNEATLMLSGGQSKFVRDQPVSGTYQKHFGASLGLSPGIVAFATNNVAIELSIGVMGVTYERTDQVHNQVTVGQTDYSSMNFKVNLFSIGVGFAFYL